MAGHQLIGILSCAIKNRHLLCEQIGFFGLFKIFDFNSNAKSQSISFFKNFKMDPLQRAHTKNVVILFFGVFQAIDSILVPKYKEISAKSIGEGIKVD